MRRLVLAAVAVVSLSWASPAFCDGAAQARAELLFKEGRKLIDTKQYAEACPKLAESQRIDPAAGTALLLGVCYEQIGKLATAYGTYKEAARLAAVRKREDWVHTATTKADAIEGRLPKLEVRVPNEARVDGLTVQLDGVTVGQAEWGVDLPVDAGPHEIVATAPGYKTFRVTVAAESGHTARAAVPKLEPGEKPLERAPPPLPQPAPDPPAPASSTQRTMGWILGGIGIAGLAAGGVTGLLALGAKSDAQKSCSAYPVGCPFDGSGTTANDRAYTWATVSTVGFVVGGVGVVGGALLILTSPSSSPKAGHVNVVPTFATSSAGLAASGIW